MPDKNSQENVCLFGETYTFIKPGFQAFISHTKKDEEFCNVIDDALKDIDFKRFRTRISLENLEPPEWKTIRQQMDKSTVLILAVGKELV